MIGYTPGQMNWNKRSDVNAKLDDFSFQQFSSTALLISQEFLILERLIYKSKNQHRRTLHMRRLELIKRIYKRFKSYPLSHCKYSLSCNSQGKLSQALVSWFRMYKLSEKFSEACILAFNAFEILLRQASFVPFAVITMSVLSRLFVLSKNFKDENLKEYHRFLSIFYDKYPNYIDELHNNTGIDKNSNLILISAPPAKTPQSPHKPPPKKMTKIIPEKKGSNEIDDIFDSLLL